MQNTSQTFRGAGAPGVNFSDHTYDNHIGAHCQPPSGYQPYSNPPYHSIPPTRPHHYANHQMQQNMPYRHHGGAYAPNQNHYGQNVNQEIYRNHHSGYVGGPNNRNMPTKPWTENNVSADLMPPYGQVSHPQMNSPSQMPVNAMRSPPHATSNMNPNPPQSQQHYRQMQSPAHSPHSWSQAQIPSPGVMHSSRTTPSPLPAHVRSPGHSQQPFSPPAAHAINMPPHPQPSENGQVPPPSMNSAGGGENRNPSNPLHSLQKMVMLDQDHSKAMLPMIGEGGEQFPNQCGSHNYLPDENVSNESKDSAYSTYYNMDENCFESKPNIAANDNSTYSAVQQVSNCNFPLPSHPVSNEEAKNTVLSNSTISNIPEVLHADHVASPPSTLSIPPPAQCKSNTGQSDCSLNLSECPPHAESAPVFTDQTIAAVSTNSEQALESNSEQALQSKLSPNLTLDGNETSNSVVAEEPTSGVDTADTNSSDTLSSTKIKCEKYDESSNSSSLQSVSQDVSPAASDATSGIEQLFDKDNSTQKNVQNNEENHSVQDSTSEKETTSNNELSSDSPNSGIGIANTPVNDPHVLKEEPSEDNDVNELGRQKVSTPSPEANMKEACLANNGKDLKVFESDTKPSVSETDVTTNRGSVNAKHVNDMTRNPVKVVIHRIRKSDTSDTWHVPGNSVSSLTEGDDADTSSEKKTESKIPNVGPQIIMLSSAVSQECGFRSSAVSNNVITIDEEEDDDDDDDDNESVIGTMEQSLTKDNSSKRGHNASPRSSCSSMIDKKRGRPIGSKNRMKPPSVKKRKGKKGKEKKKMELSKTKIPETPVKSKRVKSFNGPYVHIVGSRENPSSIKVVNVAQKEEEKLNKIQIKRNFSNSVNRIKKKQVGHLSTLSPTYDAFNRDKTWLCIFCHKGSHIGGLGDLYGPYYIKDYSESKKPSTSTSSPGSSRGKRRKSELDENKPSKRSKQSTSHSAAESTPIRIKTEDALDTDTSDLREVWIHEDCAVWGQSISLIGEEVQGLDDAVTEASENICCMCSHNGATLGCWGKGCKEQYHFSCAKNSGCQMDIENFSLLCPKHQKRSPERRNRCQ